MNSDAFSMDFQCISMYFQCIFHWFSCILLLDIHAKMLRSMASKRVDAHLSRVGGLALIASFAGSLPDHLSRARFAHIIGGLTLRKHRFVRMVLRLGLVLLPGLMLRLGLVLLQGLMQRLGLVLLQGLMLSVCRWPRFASIFSMAGRSCTPGTTHDATCRQRHIFSSCTLHVFAGLRKHFFEIVTWARRPVPQLHTGYNPRHHPPTTTHIFVYILVVVFQGFYLAQHPVLIAARFIPVLGSVLRWGHEHSQPTGGWKRHMTYET